MGTSDRPILGKCIVLHEFCVYNTNISFFWLYNKSTIA